ncbi:DNA repair protein RecN [Amaricoccus solimangrovi]|uniref:DNA repair protein RecN n=1 Tax=Amaricoccus solimangrovi TaxID=2589815 RepID=A0A501WJY3_9RHOB|nr:DNA repair protein RecN [Amaricoccus solimangrovi]TPE50173.1 DNA repair protein RecN [Amaricoccus solimangrovi]
MLNTLAIRDMLLIAEAELSFAPGLNVLTGETGAGKSILLDSLGFVLGWRTRADLVRPGAAQGEVTAAFALPPGHPAFALLDEAGIAGAEELILRRTISAEGRRQAYVNDRRVAAETLRGLSDLLVELHGQGDDRGLLDPRGHRGLLDSYARHADLLAGVRAAWAALSEARGALEAERRALEEAARDTEYLEHAVAELDALAPTAEEEPELDARRRRLRAAARIREDVAKAAQALGPEGAEGPLLQALRWLEGAAEQAEGAVDPALDALARVLEELSGAAGAVETLLDGLGGDPGELEAVEERLFAIRALARKHNLAPDLLPEFAEDLRARLGRITGGADEIVRLTAAAEAAEADYTATAARLSESRRAAARRLDAAMAEQLEPLRLGRAVFATEVEPGEPGPDGADRVRFAAATNPGAPAGPLDKVASGGELSRFLLALKVCLSARGEDPTLIFDEIDRGVGGATADAVGRRLRALGAEAQVLVVTHSPQVAARGGHHWRVGKMIEGGAAVTRVEPLDPAERVEEIARMLAGDTITDAARAAARALLES